MIERNRLSLAFHLMRIAIEGNIGCGKTTVCTLLASKLRWPVILEPLNEWHCILDRFYADPRRWGFTFNANVLASYARWTQHTDNMIFERSPMSCRHVFSVIQYKDKHIDDVELQIIDTFYKVSAWVPDIVIYLQCPPEECFNRMQQRARMCETHVSLSYIQNIHDRYETILLGPNCVVPKVFVVNADATIDTVVSNVLQVLKNEASVAMH